MQKKFFMESLNKIELALRETLKAFACFSGALYGELSKEQPFSSNETPSASYDAAGNTGNTGEDKLKFPTTKGDYEMFSLKDGKKRIKPNGSIEIRFRKFGYDKSFCGTTLEIAQSKFRIFLKEINSLYKKGKIVKKGKTVAETCELYLEKYRKFELKENSYRNLKNVVKVNVIQKIGSLQILDVTPLVIQELLTNLLSQGKGRTAEEVKCYLNGMFKIALSLGIVKSDIMQGVSIPKHYRKKGSALTIKEEQLLVEKIKDDHYEQAILFMLYSGARMSECAKFRLSDINWEQNTVKIRTTKVKDTVNGADRIVPIFPKLKELLKSLNPENEFPFLKCVTKSGKKLKTILPTHHTHELRHTFTTRCRECGIENEIVCLWTGHTFAGNTTSLVYTHFSMEYQQKLALKLNY